MTRYWVICPAATEIHHWFYLGKTSRPIIMLWRTSLFYWIIFLWMLKSVQMATTGAWVLMQQITWKKPGLQAMVNAVAIMMLKGKELLPIIKQALSGTIAKNTISVTGAMVSLLMSINQISLL